MKNYSNLNDNQLIQLFIKGDSHAFGNIVNRYKAKIFTSIYMLVRDRNLSEDIFQDVFVRIIESLKTGAYNEEGKFLPWAMRIAHNLCIDHFRKLKRLPVIKNSQEQDIFNLLNFSEAGTDEKMVQDERRNRVRKMLDMLPDDQREVIILRHFANLSFREIAALSKISINTALGRMRYGLMNIRKLMMEQQIAV